MEHKSIVDSRNLPPHSDINLHSSKNAQNEGFSKADRTNPPVDHKVSAVTSGRTRDLPPGDLNPFATRSQTIPGPLPHNAPNPLHAPDYYVEVFSDLHALEREREAWNDLLDHSVEPNVFTPPIW